MYAIPFLYAKITFKVLILHMEDGNERKCQKISDNIIMSFYIIRFSYYFILRSI